MITQITIGLVMFAVGTLIVIFSEAIYNFTGSIDAVERKFPGSSRSFIKILGILLIILGVVTFTGLWIFALQPLQGLFRPL